MECLGVYSLRVLVSMQHAHMNHNSPCSSLQMLPDSSWQTYGTGPLSRLFHATLHCPVPFLQPMRMLIPTSRVGGIILNLTQAYQQTTGEASCAGSSGYGLLM